MAGFFFYPPGAALTLPLCSPAAYASNCPFGLRISAFGPRISAFRCVPISAFQLIPPASRLAPSPTPLILSARFMTFLEQIEPLKQSALAEMRAASDLAALEQGRVNYLGTNGRFTALMKQLGTLPKEEKPTAGKAINSTKIELEAALAQRRAELEFEAALPTEPTDFTAPGRRRTLGKLHPLTQVTEDIVRSFRKIGFAVADGPEVEDDYHCFDALNTPTDHPARDTQDTFYLAGVRPSSGAVIPEPATATNLLLRTHTSSVQIRVMAKQQPPVRIIVPGRVYRRDNADATHNPTFQQVEGLYVDRNVTVGDLKGTVEFVFQELMGSETRIRFRPHYFSYTEPVSRSISAAR